MMRNRLFSAAAVGLVLATAACGGDKAAEAAGTAQAATPAPAAVAAGSQTALGQAVAPTGTVHEIQMITDDRGNYYQPAEIVARPGDVLRFVLVSGVHNATFPSDKNPGVAGLPGPGTLLQLPGMSTEMVVGLPAGTYPFHCDPHAALGMVGTLTVQ